MSRASRGLLLCAIACTACANDGVARDCDHAVAALTASGEAECATYCMTSIPCALADGCTLAPYGCNARSTQCESGRLVVITTGHACDSGPPDHDDATNDASLDAP